DDRELPGEPHDLAALGDHRMRVAARLRTFALRNSLACSGAAKPNSSAAAMRPMKAREDAIETISVSLVCASFVALSHHCVELICRCGRGLAPACPGDRGLRAPRCRARACPVRQSPHWPAAAAP